MSEIVGVHKITVGDTLLPLNSVLRKANGDPYNLASYTVKFAIEADDGTEALAATATGVSSHPTQTFTAATTDWLSCNDHGISEGDQIIVSSATTLPAGLAASTRYFVRDVEPNRFKVSLSPGGSVVDVTDTGSGTHSFYVVGSVQFDFASTEVDTAGSFRAWFQLSSGGETWYVPEGDRYYRILVVARGK